MYLAERRTRLEDRRIYRFVPGGDQAPNSRQIEFFNLCQPHMEMGLCGINQGGKTFCAGAFFGIHALEDYEEWPHYTEMRIPGDILMFAISGSFELYGDRKSVV